MKKSSTYFDATEYKQLNVKTNEIFFQILWPSHYVLTLTYFMAHSVSFGQFLVQGLSSIFVLKHTFLHKLATFCIKLSMKRKIKMEDFLLYA